MSEAGHKHNDSSHSWLIFFFVCFASSVLALGVWACFNYKAPDETVPVAAPAAGGH